MKPSRDQEWGGGFEAERELRVLRPSQDKERGVFEAESRPRMRGGSRPSRDQE